MRQISTAWASALLMPLLLVVPSTAALECNSLLPDFSKIEITNLDELQELRACGKSNTMWRLTDGLASNISLDGLEDMEEGWLKISSFWGSNYNTTPVLTFVSSDTLRTVGVIEITGRLLHAKFPRLSRASFLWVTSALEVELSPELSVNDYRVRDSGLSELPSMYPELASPDTNPLWFPTNPGNSLLPSIMITDNKNLGGTFSPRLRNGTSEQQFQQIVVVNNAPEWRIDLSSATKIAGEARFSNLEEDPHLSKLNEVGTFRLLNGSFPEFAAPIESAEQIVICDNPNLRLLNLSSLVRVNRRLVVSGNPLLTDLLDFSSLRETSDLELYGNFTTLPMPALETVRGYFLIQSPDPAFNCTAFIEPIRDKLQGAIVCNGVLLKKPPSGTMYRYDGCDMDFLELVYPNPFPNHPEWGLLVDDA